MTDKDYVIRACEMKAIDLIKPTKRALGIVATDWNRKVSGVHPCVIDADTWGDARKQVDAYLTKLSSNC